MEELLQIEAPRKFFAESARSLSELRAKARKDENQAVLLHRLCKEATKRYTTSKRRKDIDIDSEDVTGTIKEITLATAEHGWWDLFDKMPTERKINPDCVKYLCYNVQDVEGVSNKRGSITKIFSARLSVSQKFDVYKSLMDAYCGVPARADLLECFQIDAWQWLEQLLGATKFHPTRDDGRALAILEANIASDYPTIYDEQPIVNLRRWLGPPPHAPCINFKLLAEPKLGTADPQLLYAYVKTLVGCELTSKHFNEEDRSGSVARGVSLLFHRFSYISQTQNAHFTLTELKDMMKIASCYSWFNTQHGKDIFDPHYLKDMQDAITCEKRQVKGIAVNQEYMESILLRLAHDIMSDNVACLTTNSQANYVSPADSKTTQTRNMLTDRITSFLLTVLSTFITMNLEHNIAVSETPARGTRHRNREQALRTLEKIGGGPGLPLFAKYIKDAEIEAIRACDSKALRKLQQDDKNAKRTTALRNAEVNIQLSRQQDDIKPMSQKRAAGACNEKENMHPSSKRARLSA